jgi:nucleotide-binding universal stress UspA family protein
MTSTMAGRGFELGCDGPGALMVGIDGSDTSWRALYYAYGLARRQHSTVIAVFVITTLPDFAGTTMTLADQTTALIADELRPTIEGLAADYGVRTTFISLTGDPVTTLAKLAAQHRADALIIGASHAFLHRVLGSKSLRAVRRCRCPVTIVP